MFLTYFIVIAVPIFLILFILTAAIHIFFFIPYVPSQQRVVKKMVKLAHIKKNEKVFDLGCGDGRLLIAAEKAAPKVQAEGFEIAPLMYIMAQVRLLIARSRAQIHFQNLFNVNLKPANVIFCYLFPNVMPRLVKKIKKECKRGTRIVSNTFSIPGLRLVKKITRNMRTGTPSIYIYRV